MSEGARSPFSLALAETIEWCAARAQPIGAGITTRSALLRPPIFSWPGARAFDLLFENPAERRDAVAFIVEQRRAALAAAGSKAGPLKGLGGEVNKQGLAGGRVFATDFASDLCGAAAEPSNGFVDTWDIPGWDTWFAHGRSEQSEVVVYGWVPPQLVELADAGFKVIPVQCIWWVEEAALQRLLS